jgi:hypothetical protein
VCVCWCVCVRACVGVLCLCVCVCVCVCMSESKSSIPYVSRHVHYDSQPGEKKPRQNTCPDTFGPMTWQWRHYYWKTPKRRCMAIHRLDKKALPPHSSGAEDLTLLLLLQVSCVLILFWFDCMTVAIVLNMFKTIGVDCRSLKFYKVLHTFLIRAPRSY